MAHLFPRDLRQLHVFTSCLGLSTEETDKLYPLPWMITLVLLLHIQRLFENCSNGETEENSTDYIKIRTSFSHIASVFTLSSQAKAKRGFCGCQATVKVGALHCTSQILSPVSTIA